MRLDITRIPHQIHSNYPTDFQPQVAGRSKRLCSDLAEIG